MTKDVALVVVDSSSNTEEAIKRERRITITIRETIDSNKVMGTKETDPKHKDNNTSKSTKPEIPNKKTLRKYTEEVVTVVKVVNINPAVEIEEAAVEVIIIEEVATTTEADNAEVATEVANTRLVDVDAGIVTTINAKAMMIVTIITPVPTHSRDMTLTINMIDLTLPKTSLRPISNPRPNTITNPRQTIKVLKTTTMITVKKMKALDVAVEAGATMDQATEAEEEEVAEVPIEADFMIKSQRVSKRLVVSDLYN